jgi:cell wall integrity and stress response component
MRSILALSVALAAMLAGPCAARNLFHESLVVARQDTTYTYEGCFKSSGSLKRNGTNQWQSRKQCHDTCVPMNAAVESTSNGDECWCGNAIPPTADKVDDSLCNFKCTGYPAEMCGSDSTFSVYLTGVGTPDNSSSSVSPSSTPSTSASPSVIYLGGQTVVVTAGPTQTPGDHSSPNKAAIAAGVVVGLIVFAAAAGGGAFLYLRRRRNRQVEEEYRRNAAISEFVAGGKSHSSSNRSYSDTRLDPTVMAQRRMSDGSIADNEDYSRRILKVTNA